MRYVFDDKNALIKFLDEKVKMYEKRLKDFSPRTNAYIEASGNYQAYLSMQFIVEKLYFKDVKDFILPDGE